MSDWNVRQDRLPRQLAALFAGLRWRIRAYVLAQGIAWLLIVAGIWCVGSLMLDRQWELPRQGRQIVLALGGVAGLIVLWKGVVSRCFTWLSARSLATLLERQRPELRGSLVTAVELTQKGNATGKQASPYLAKLAIQEAIHGLRDVHVPDLFRAGPLRRAWLMVALLAVGLGSSALLQPRLWKTWYQRQCLLAEKPWPRQTLLSAPQFVNGVAKVARGADFQLKVLADTVGVVPEIVRLNYRTTEGARGQENLTRIGTAVPGVEPFQEFRHEFQGVLASVDLGVFGGDGQLTELRLEVVDPPSLVQLMLDCEYPEYTGKPRSQSIPVTGLMPFPAGSQLLLQGKTNKPLKLVKVERLESHVVGKPQPAGKGAEGALANAEEAKGEEADSLEIPLPPCEVTGTGFLQRIPPLRGDQTLLISLEDADGIASRQPQRVTLTALPDEAPKVESQLLGIGSKVTPNARLPLRIQVTDDYGVAKIWTVCQVDAQPPVRAPLPGGQLSVSRETAVEVKELAAAPGNRLMLTIEAEDDCQLPEGVHKGSSSQTVLEVVTPEELQALIERKELLLRQRLEAIIEELEVTRNSLEKLAIPATVPVAQTRGPSLSAPVTLPGLLLSAVLQVAEDPAEEKAEGASSAQKPASDEQVGSDERAWAIRKLTVERALQNGLRGADEALGVALSVEEMLLELTNNRLDTAELRERLQVGVADPLKACHAESFSKLESLLRNLTAQVEARGGDPATSIAQLEVILNQLRLVLTKMRELEDFNEILDMLRGIISEHQAIEADTEQRRKQKVLDLLGE